MHCCMDRIYRSQENVRLSRLASEKISRQSTTDSPIPRLLSRQEEIDIRVDAPLTQLKMGDGLDIEEKGASRTEAKRKKKGKGGRGEKLDPIVQNRNDLTAKLAEGVDFAEEWWVETVEQGKLGCEVGVGVPYTVCLAQAWEDFEDGWALKVSDIAPLFMRILNSTEGQNQLLACLATHLREQPGGFAQMPEALKAFYDEELLDEDVLVRRPVPSTAGLALAHLTRVLVSRSTQSVQFVHSWSGSAETATRMATPRMRRRLSSLGWRTRRPRWRTVTRPGSKELCRLARGESRNNALLFVKPSGAPPCGLPGRPRPMVSQPFRRGFNRPFQKAWQTLHVVRRA